MNAVNKDLSEVGRAPPIQPYLPGAKEMVPRRWFDVLRTDSCRKNIPGSLNHAKQIPSLRQTGFTSSGDLWPRVGMDR